MQASVAVYKIFLTDRCFYVFGFKRFYRIKKHLMTRSVFGDTAVFYNASGFNDKFILTNPHLYFKI